MAGGPADGSTCLASAVEVRWASNDVGNGVIRKQNQSLVLFGAGDRWASRYIVIPKYMVLAKLAYSLVEMEGMGKWKFGRVAKL